MDFYGLKKKCLIFFRVVFLLGTLFVVSACQPHTETIVDTPPPLVNNTVQPTESAVMAAGNQNTLAPTVVETQPVLEITASPISFTMTSTSVPTATVQVTPTMDMRLLPNDWRNWPIIPNLSTKAYQIYQSGLEQGNDPTRFSVIGDCQSAPEVFFGIYETDWYWLGEDYAYLQETIDYYQGSFSHESLAVKGGMSTSTALSPLWADQEKCSNNENPVECELRDYQPSIVFINLGTNWRADASTVPYEQYLRKIVEIVIDHGTLPVLLTKADNIEGDYSINLITAKVAYDNDVPLVNFWMAAQSLTHKGLDESTNFIYLTPDGWDRRNFVALQSLDAVHRQIGVYDEMNTP